MNKLLCPLACMKLGSQFLKEKSKLQGITYNYVIICYEDDKQVKLLLRDVWLIYQQKQESDKAS